MTWRKLCTSLPGPFTARRSIDQGELSARQLPSLPMTRDILVYGLIVIAVGEESFLHLHLPHLLRRLLQPARIHWNDSSFVQTIGVETVLPIHQQLNLVFRRGIWNPNLYRKIAQLLLPSLLGSESDLPKRILTIVRNLFR